MSRIIAVAKKNILQLLHQKGALVMTFVAPVVTFSLLSLVFSSSSSSKPLIEMLNPPASLKELMKNYNTVDAHLNSSNSELTSRVIASKNAVGLSFEGGKATIYIGGTSFAQNQKNLKLTKEFLSLIKNPSSSDKGIAKKTSSKIVYLHSIENLTMFETMAPGMISVMIMFFVFVITGMAFLGEKSSGTLERVFITPLRIYELVAGYIISFGLIALVQVAIFQAFYYYVFKLQVNGSFFQATLVSIVTAFVALTFGMLVSSFAKTQFQVMQTIPIFIAPQMVLCGIFDISGANFVVRLASKAMPMTYSVSAIQKILLEHKNIFDVRYEIVTLFGFIAVFTMGTYIFLGRYKPKFLSNGNNKGEK